MNGPRRLSGLIALVIALVIAGCGADDGAGDTTTTITGATTTPLSGETTTTSSGDESSGSEVVMQSISFQPDEITVDAGTEVTWTNEDGVAHTVTSDETIFDSGNLSSGESFSHTFDEAGTFTYFCQIHPSMQATVTVEN